MNFKNVRLLDFGYELPPKVLTSADIESQLKPVYEKLKLPEGRLELMSGIKERRLWEAGTKPSDGAVLAGKKAIENSGVKTEELGALIFSSVSRDMMEPATANFVHAQLGLSPSCIVYDISNACLGFLNSMITLGNMIEMGQVTSGLIVASETAEELIETTIKAILNDNSITRKSIKSYFASLTISSGAVGLVMCHKDHTSSTHELLGGAIKANTEFSNLCQGGKQGSGTLMETDSETLLHKGIETASWTWPAFLENLSWTPDTANHYFTHQVGKAHSKLLFDSLGIDVNKNYPTLETMGNNGSVAAPLALALGLDNNVVSQGDNIALLGIGSGINCLMLGIQW